MNNHPTNHHSLEVLRGGLDDRQPRERIVDEARDKARRRAIALRALITLTIIVAALLALASVR